MRVLVACEFSGIVRDAFIARGHDAVSCDLEPSERPGPHIQGDVLDVLRDNWDMGLFFPPCTDLATSGAKHFKAKGWERQKAALDFFRDCLDAPIPRRAVENPVSIASTHIRKPDQIIQPWEHGHSETKRTCIWVVNLPLLTPTNIIKQTTLDQRNIGRVHHEPPGPDRWKNRSRTYQGIADAMADQWGGLPAPGRDQTEIVV